MLQIDNRERVTLDGYTRFLSAAPCWSDDSTDKFLAASDLSHRYEWRDGLWNFTATW
jgi:hypothetical protein